MRYWLYIVLGKNQWFWTRRYMIQVDQYFNIWNDLAILGVTSYHVKSHRYSKIDSISTDPVQSMMVANRGEHVVSDILFEVKLTFDMLTVLGQQHSFSTHEQMFLWKCQKFWDRKCLDLRGTEYSLLRTLLLSLFCTLIAQKRWTRGMNHIEELSGKYCREQDISNCHDYLLRTRVSFIENRDWHNIN